MAGLDAAALRAEIQAQLIDAGTEASWSNAQLDYYIDQVAREISGSIPQQKKTGLAVVDATKYVDISSLTDYLKIVKVECPQNTQRDFNIWGDRLTLKLDNAITADDTTLTGTATFTKDSKDVAGTNTAFEGELSAGDFIQVEDADSWYQIESITSDTALVLVDAFVETTAEDKSVTKRSASCVAVIYWGADHVVGEEASTVPTRYNKLMIEGGVAYACMAWLGEIPQRVESAVTSLESANTAIGNMTARITQAVTDINTVRTAIATQFSNAATALGKVAARVEQGVTDLGSLRTELASDAKDLHKAEVALGNIDDLITQATTDLGTLRTNTGTNLTSAGTALTSAGTALGELAARITQALADLTSGRAKINTVNYGDEVPENYANYAQTELNTGGKHVDSAYSYLTEAERYLSKAERNLNYLHLAEGSFGTAKEYVNQATGYLGKFDALAKYITLATGEVEAGLGYVKEAESYFAAVNAYVNSLQTATAEMYAAEEYFHQSQGYIALVSPHLNVAGIVSSWRNIANTRMSIYLASLKSIGPIIIGRTYPRD